MGLAEWYCKGLIPYVPDRVMVPVSFPSIIPGSTVGVIGGGQLAWMLGQAAQNLGVSLHVQTPNPHDPAVAMAQRCYFGSIQSLDLTRQLAQGCDVVTFENEFVDLDGLQTLVDQGVVFAPRLANLRPLLDKYDQRSYCQSLGLPTPNFCVLTADNQGHPHNPWGFPVVLKARRHGYDGQGTHIVYSGEELGAIVSNRSLDEFLLEEFIPFQRELAIMVARSSQGEVALYPVVETQQVHQVCQRVIAPAGISPMIAEQVQTMAQTFVDILGGVGIFGLEFFLTQDDRVLINEIAPRTHNSGHYTIDACVTSQFEQQLRSILSEPLGETTLIWPGALMVNLLGFETDTSDYHEQRQAIQETFPQAQIYWYGKERSQPGRKLGHLTLPLDDPNDTETIATIVQTLETIWPSY